LITDTILLYQGISQYYRIEPRDIIPRLSVNYTTSDRLISAVTFWRVSKSIRKQIVLPLSCFGGFLAPIFYHLIFSNYCHISSSTLLSPVKEKILDKTI
jgi:hypothetical protein